LKILELAQREYPFDASDKFSRGVLRDFSLPMEDKVRVSKL